jgi:adenylate cyclase
MSSQTRDQLFKTLQRNLNSFGVYNKNKTDICLKLFSASQRDAFLLIPYLLHSASPQRFSFHQDRRAPSGIVAYRQPTGLQQLCKKHFGDQETYDLRTTDQNSPIEFLSIMGSIGSIAYTDKSDLDYWCCIRNDLTLQQKSDLLLKFEKIEQWCMQKLQVEVHFFLTTDEQLQRNDFGEVSTESCGSALGKLLKEEYYRGSLHVGGKIPLWWVVPYSTGDYSYDSIKLEIEETPNLLSEPVIDAGNLIHIPHEEFLGGGLWQLNKGIQSPFKSILKLGLLMAYADNEGNQSLLAESLRILVQKSPQLTINFDPYCEMMNFVLFYFQKSNNNEQLKLLQICFFTKVKQTVSKWMDSQKEPDNPHSRLMLKYVKQWGWTKKMTEQWENIDHISLKNNLKLKNDVESFMLNGFQHLVSGLKNFKISSIVSESDLSRLLNRILAIYDPTRSRIEWLYPPFSNCVKHKAFSLIHTQMGMWRLYRGEIHYKSEITALEEKNFIRSSKLLEDQCLWLIYNGFLEHKTKIFTNLPKADDFINNLKTLREVYRQQLGSPVIPDLDKGGFEKDPEVISWLISANLIPGQDIFLSPSAEKEEEAELSTLFSRAAYDGSETPKSNLVHQVLENINTRSDQNLEQESLSQQTKVTEFENVKLQKVSLSSDEDPINATISRINLLNSILLISKNNWGEVNYRIFTGEKTLIKTLLLFLENYDQDQTFHDHQIEFHSGQDAFDPRQMTGRLKNIFEQVVDFFIRDRSTSSSTPKFFFIEIGGELFCIELSDGHYRYRNFQNLAQAGVTINIEFPFEVRIAFDQSNKSWEFFNLAIQNHKSGKVHCAFHKGELNTQFFVLDEWKHFTHHTVTSTELRAYYPRFIQSIINSKFGVKNQQSFEPNLRVFSFSKQHLNDCTIESLKLLKPSLERLQRIDLQVPFEGGLHFLKTYSEKGRYIFESDILKNEVKFGLKEIHKLRLGKGSKRHYPVFFNYFELLPDEEMGRHLNTCLTLNLKLGLERACQLVFINT